MPRLTRVSCKRRSDFSASIMACPSNRFTTGIIRGALSVGLVLVACFVHARPRRHTYRGKTAGDGGGAQAAGKSK